jgi:hypothetical protein
MRFLLARRGAFGVGLEANDILAIPVEKAWIRSVY